jgi:hypothetical protein
LNTLYNVALCVCALSLISIAPSQAAPVPGQGTWETTLHGRDVSGDGSLDAYWDQTLDITWLADAQYSGGSLSWYTANAWALNLELANDGSEEDWSLPLLSNLRSLFEDTLGNTYAPPEPGNLTNTTPFDNIQLDWYWSSQQWMPQLQLPNWWAKHADAGTEGGKAGATDGSAWAVHPGDIGTPVIIPEPSTLPLLGSALSLLGFMRLRMRRRSSS